MPGLNFLPLKPFAWAWATTLDGASEVIQAVYAEMVRRKQIFAKLQRPNFQSTTAEEKREHDLVPITVLIDEFGSLSLPIPVPKSLLKDHPLVEELKQQNAAKEIIGTYVGKLAREARFAGIFVQVALQRGDASIISGELRSNLGMRLQLVPANGIMEQTSLGMLFDSSMLDSVRERVATLTNGSQGLAIMAGETGQVEGVKIPFMDAEFVEAELLSRGLTPATKFLRVHEGDETLTISDFPLEAQKEMEKETDRLVAIREEENRQYLEEMALTGPAWLDDDLDLSDVDPL